MSESFADLLEESSVILEMKPGTLVKGTIMEIGNDWIIVDAGLKSQAVVPTDEFRNEDGEIEVSVGDEVDLALEMMEDGYGETRLSRRRARLAEAWTELVRAHESNETVKGIITNKVKGGFTVEINKVRAFLPGSLVDVRPIRDTSYLEGKELDFKVIKIDKKRNNVVVSRRSVVEEESSAERMSILENLKEGDVVKGVVKNLVDYGAFVDLGGVDGLLHITDMSWKRVKHPNEIVNVGDEIDVVILKFDKDRSRVSLGLKQMWDDPWSNIDERYPVDTVLTGIVTNIADYGCFVEIEDGVEGLVHVSEMDWTNKNVNPNKVVKVGDEVRVKVLDIDGSRRRISLGIKQCMDNPWQNFADKHNKDEHIVGKIKSITDFGIFIGLEGGIDGLVHLSDISWTLPGEQAVRDYKKGQEIRTIILTIDPERERISLGIKQLDDDPFANFLDVTKKGSFVKGTVTEVDAKGAQVELGTGVIGHLRASEISKDEKITDATQHLKVGDEVEAKYMNADRKNRIINLSIKAMEVQSEAEKLEDFAKNSEMGKTTLGDIMKEQMEGKE